MSRSIRLAQLVALVAVCLCVFVSPVLGQGCLEEVGWFPDRPADEVAVSGDFAYITYGGTFNVVDVSNPAAPQLRGGFFSDYHPGEFLSDIEISGDYAYMVEWVHPPNNVPPLRVLILDISNPDLPTLVGVYTTSETPWAGGWIEVAGNYVILGLYSSSVLIIDVSDPSDPFLTATFSPAHELWSMAVGESGQYAYLSEVDSGSGTWYLETVDIRNPTNPVQGGIRTPGYLPYMVVVGEFFGQYLMIWADVDGSSIYVFDVHDPSNPVLLPSSQVSFGHGGWPVGSATPDQIAYMSFISGPPIGSELSIFAVDVSDPNSPLVVGEVWTAGGGLAASARHVFLADSENGLRIFGGCAMLADGFESGDTSAWSSTVP